MFLDKELYLTVIKSTPLVSIDLVVKSKQGQALLGKRLNKPAKDFWFVPGGRILKNESLASAFKRLTLEELGHEFYIQQASFLAPFDHFYDDHVYGNDLSTHYVALAYVLTLECALEKLPLNIQHGNYHWFNIDELMQLDDVHKHTKNYFL